MHEFAAPTSSLVVTGNLTDDVLLNAVEVPETGLFSVRADGTWQDVTAGRFKDDVVAVARGLLAHGLRLGDRVGVICKNRYEWTLLDYAIWWVGAATVPIYETCSVEQIEWILSDSGAVACIVETQAHREKVGRLEERLPLLEQVWTIDDAAVPELVALGASVTTDELEQRRAGVAAEHLATVLYTSGTTGRPRGCMLTHGNLLFEVGVAVDTLPELFERDDASTLLFLPLAHVFARIIQVGCVRARVRMGYVPRTGNLVEEIGRFQPTFVLAVPRALEMLFNSVSQKAHSQGTAKLFDSAVSVAIAFSRATDRGRTGPMLRLRHALLDRLVYGTIRDALGGRMRYAVSGGAPLGERLAHFFRGVGVTVLEGYGLTETTGAVTVNLPGSLRIGTVGRPLPGTSVRRADDGELLFKGGQVFAGYWHDQTATHEALDAEGWLHTGDVGEIDDDGFVRISGRKKEIVVTAGGKNVSPAALEDVIRGHPLVSHALVVGEARPFVAALIALDPKGLSEWQHRHGKRGKVSDPASDPKLVAEVQRAVDAANATVSQAESIRRFRILLTDWSEESGHVTPTGKLKRNVVMRDFAEAVERMYRQGTTQPGM